MPAAEDKKQVTARAPARRPSGAAWVRRFPTSKRTDDLASPFRENVERFIAALLAAGASVTISATLRPPERAYLMHWSWSIVNRKADPRDVPSRKGVDIRWDHVDQLGEYSSQASLAGATAMVNAYGIRNLRVAPALNSRHIEGNAIDMTLGWRGTLTVEDAQGNVVRIATTPRTGMNTLLHGIAASFGVIKFLGGDSDKSHWSNDGR